MCVCVCVCVCVHRKLPERVFKSLVGFTSQNRLRKLVAKVLAHQIKLTDHGRLEGVRHRFRFRFPFVCAWACLSL